MEVCLDHGSVAFIQADLKNREARQNEYRQPRGLHDSLFYFTEIHLSSPHFLAIQSQKKRTVASFLNMNKSPNLFNSSFLLHNLQVHFKTVKEALLKTAPREAVPIQGLFSLHTCIIKPLRTGMLWCRWDLSDRTTTLDTIYWNVHPWHLQTEQRLFQ